MAEIGEIIRRKREEKDWNQHRLGEKVGSQGKQVKLWEAGKVQPGAYYLGRLADVFGCSVDELMGRDAVKPVRCRNCANYRTFILFGRAVSECKVWEEDPGPDGYCHKGKEFGHG